MMPVTRGLLNSLIYFAIFTVFVVVLREPLAEAQVPPQFVPVVITCGLMIPVFLVMTLLLTVFFPERLFAFQKKSRRWGRFATYMALFVLLSVILPFFPANKGSDFSWIAGVFPMFLFLIMVQPIKPPVKLAAVPRSRDSRWRHLKYSGVYFLATLLPAAAVLVYALNLDKGEMTTESLVLPMYLGNGVIYLVQLALLHRLIVVKPHSRFDGMSTAARYKRFGAYVLSLVVIGMAVPWIIATYWPWRFDMYYSLVLAIVLFMGAAYGTDASPFKGATIFSGPAAATREGMNTAIKRRLDALKQDSASA